VRRKLANVEETQDCLHARVLGQGLVRPAGTDVRYETIHLIVPEPGRPHDDHTTVAAQDDELPLRHVRRF
jgi:hypothetical protein